MCVVSSRCDRRNPRNFAGTFDASKGPMATTQKSARMFVIGVAVDFGDASGYAFDQAARIARRIPACMLQIIHVVKADAAAKAISKAGTDLRIYLVEKATALGGLHGQNAGIQIRSGDAAREIVQFAADIGADMLILGTHKTPNLKSLFVGSVAEKVVAYATCPVVVAGPKPPEATLVPT